MTRATVFINSATSLCCLLLITTVRREGEADASRLEVQRWHAKQPTRGLCEALRVNVTCTYARAQAEDYYVAEHAAQNWIPRLGTRAVRRVDAEVVLKTSKPLPANSPNVERLLPRAIISATKFCVGRVALSAACTRIIVHRNCSSREIISRDGRITPLIRRERDTS